jgi:hypothetical protein
MHDKYMPVMHACQVAEHTHSCLCLNPAFGYFTIKTFHIYSTILMPEPDRPLHELATHIQATGIMRELMLG